MLWYLAVFALSVLGHAAGQLHPTKPAKYQRLPSLREQAEIMDRWRQQRLDALPNLMKKYGVDAWLVRHEKFHMKNLPFDTGITTYYKYHIIRFSTSL